MGCGLEGARSFQRRLEGQSLVVGVGHDVGKADHGVAAGPDGPVAVGEEAVGGSPVREEGHLSELAFE